MLCKVKTLIGYKLDSLDGEIGKIKEFYFDDEQWVVRYLVAETGSWLMNRQVLISPHALVGVINEDKLIAINLTKKQIEDSPSTDSDKPISRHFEDAMNGANNQGWNQSYSSGLYMDGVYSYIIPSIEDRKNFIRDQKIWDLHLRSTHDVSGYNIHAIDGNIGHVDDFIIDDSTWDIRYMVVDTQNWWPGKKVLISPKWIQRVSWKESKVFLNLSADDIKQSPEYTEDSLLTRDYETWLYKHYSQEGYWTDKADHLIQKKNEKEHVVR
jgi:hypothetical protein